VNRVCHAATPGMSDRLPDLQFATAGVFCPLDDLENVTPWQWCKRLLRNWTLGEFACKNLHGHRLREDSPLMSGNASLVGIQRIDDFSMCYSSLTEAA
jgi:hypothetical protein